MKKIFWRQGLLTSQEKECGLWTEFSPGLWVNRPLSHYTMVSLTRWEFLAEGDKYQWGWEISYFWRGRGILNTIFNSSKISLTITTQTTITQNVCAYFSKYENLMSFSDGDGISGYFSYGIDFWLFFPVGPGMCTVRQVPSPFTPLWFFFNSPDKSPHLLIFENIFSSPEKRSFCLP